MSSPDGSNNHRFTFNTPRQSPSAVIRLNRNAFVTMPTQHSQSSSTRPILIRPYYVPISQHQIVIPSVIPMTSVIRPQRPVHFKVTSAGKVITPRSSATPLNQTRPLAMARRPLTRPSGKALCSNCGVQSSDLETCESCWKNIKRQGPTSNTSTVENQVAKNIEDGLRATREEIERKSRKGIPSSSFYNGKAGESDFARYVRKAAVVTPNMAKQATLSVRSYKNPTAPRPQLKRSLLKRNTASASESVCITISSDSEGEDAANSSTVTVQAADSSTVSNDQSQSEECETPNKKPRRDTYVSSTQPVEVKIQPLAPPQQPTAPTYVSAKSDEDIAKATLNLKIESVRIGQMKLKPTSVLRISQDSLTMTARCTYSDADRILTIKWANVASCEICGDEREPCLYLSLHQGSLPHFREQLEMEKGKFPYFDPLGEADEKYFILYICRLFFLSNTSNILAGMVRKIDLVRKKLKRPSTFLCRIGFTESEQRQMLAAARMEQEILEETEQVSTTEVLNITTESNTSSSSLVLELTPNRAVTRNKSKEMPDDLKFMFTGPRVELFVYPPPPTKGGIPVTNEDQFCLNDGEFLNDVIIEFYLKYVYHNIISNEDRERSRIFSCFFYERLMQKSKKLKDVSPAERRHSQVKKWTRNEDIFSKDFIFIPINEAAHWYLAVICFPGLDGGIVEFTKANGEKVVEKVNKVSIPPSSSIQDSINHNENKGEGSNAKSHSDKDRSKENEDSKIQPMSTPEQALEKIHNCAQSGKPISTSQPKLIEVAEKRRLVSVKIPNFTVRRKRSNVTCSQESIFSNSEDTANISNPQNAQSHESRLTDSLEHDPMLESLNSPEQGVVKTNHDALPSDQITNGSCHGAKVKPSPEAIQDERLTNALEEKAIVQSQSTRRTKHDSSNVSEKNENDHCNKVVLVRTPRTGLPVMNTFGSNPASLTSKDLASSSGETDISLGEITAGVRQNRSSVSSDRKSVCNTVALRNRNTTLDIVKATHLSGSSQSAIIKATHPSTSQSVTVKETHPSTSRQFTIVNATHPFTASQSAIVKATHPSTSSQSAIVKATHPSTSSQSTSVNATHPSTSSQSTIIKETHPSTSSQSAVMAIDYPGSSGNETAVMPHGGKNSTPCKKSKRSGDEDSTRASEHKNDLLEIFVNPGSPVFLLPKELKDKCSISSSRMPEVRMPRVSNESPIKIKNVRSYGISALSSSLSSDEAVIISSSDHSDCEATRNTNGPHTSMEHATAQTGEISFTTCTDLVKIQGQRSHSATCTDLVKSQGQMSKSATCTDLVRSRGQMSNSATCTDLVKSQGQRSNSVMVSPMPLHLSFETSTHDLSDCDVITIESSQSLNSENSLTENMTRQSMQRPREAETPSFLDAALSSVPLGIYSEMPVAQSSPLNACTSTTISTVELEDNHVKDFKDCFAETATAHNAESDGHLDCTKTVISEVQDITLNNDPESGVQQNTKTGVELTPRGPNSDVNPSGKDGDQIQKSSSGVYQNTKTGVELTPRGPNSDENPSGKDGGDQIQNSSIGGNNVSGNGITIPIIIRESCSSDAGNGMQGEEGDVTDPGCAEAKDVEEDIRVFKRPCILIFDSLRGPSRSKIATSLREYLSMEWRTRKERSHGAKIFDKDTMKMCSVLVPQQDNFTDCGLFLLHYVEKFFTKPIDNFSLPLKMDSWFDPDECKQKRTDIEKIIDELHKNWTAEQSQEESVDLMTPVE